MGNSRISYSKVLLGALLSLLYPLFASAAFVGGATYPLPNNTGLVTMSGSGMGRTGGEAWTFASATPTAQQMLWWGAALNGAQLSFNSNTFAGAGETMTYNAGLSNPVGGTVIYTGSTTFSGNSTPVFTRLVMTFTENSNGPLIASSTLNIDTSGAGAGTVGEVLPLNATPMGYSVNLQMQASYSSNSGFQPALDFYDAAGSLHGGGGTAYSSFSGGYYFDTPPTIGSLSSTSIVVQESATSGLVTFQVGDAETGANGVTVTATSDNQTSVPNANITLGGNGSSRTVSVTATATSGLANIALTASDGVLSSSTVLQVRVNAPPKLDTNSALSLAQGGTAALNASNLLALDPDTSSAPTFVVTGQPHIGTLLLNGVASPTSFTQNDIAAGHVTYGHDGSCNLSDNFQFEVEDVDGAFANDPARGPGATIYNFGINVIANQTAPSAQSASYNLALGATLNQSVVATTTDCSNPAITYQLASGPAHGTLTGPDANTGGFTYTANAGYSGSDSFQFRGVTYGNDASPPATISFNIQAAAPNPQPGSIATLENTSASGTLSATDPNMPPQSITYAIATTPSKGAVVLNDAHTGAFTYTPNAGAIGADSFTFTAANSALTSAPATVTVLIRGKLHAGEIVVADGGDRNTNPASIVLFDPVSGQQALVSKDPQFGMLLGVTVGNDGNVFVTSQGNTSGQVFRVDPNTGVATPIGSPFGQAVGIATEASGELLVADAKAGVVVRMDPATGAAVGSPMSLGAKTAPLGIVPVSDGSFYVSDGGALFAGATANSIFHANAYASAVTTVATGGHLNTPIGFARIGSTLYAANASFGPGGSNDVIAIDATSGTQTVLASGNLLNGPSGLALVGGQLYAASSTIVVDIDPTSAQQTQAASGQFLHSPFALSAVSARPTVTSIVSETPDPSSPGANYTVSVSVAPASGSGTPGGSVAVSDGAGANCNVVLTNGTGSCQLASAAPGNVTLSANYGGNATFASSSATSAHTVNPYTTTTSITSTASSTVGQSFAVTVSVTAPTGTPDGNVSVSDDASPAHTCGPVALVNGGATCNITWNAAGTYNLTASYIPGTPAQFASSTSATQAHTVTKGTTTVSVSPASGSDVIDTAYQVGVVVAVTSPAQGTATGSVTIADGAGDSCTIAALDNTGAGNCQLTPTSAGSKTLTATYAGDSNFSSNTGTAGLTVTRATSTTLLATPCQRTFVSGEPFTLGASVTGVSPSGTLLFLKNGTTTLCSTTLNTGKASCTTTALTTTGTDRQDVYSLTASYAGDTTNLSSVSGLLNVTVLSATEAVFRNGFEVETATCPIE